MGTMKRRMNFTGALSMASKSIPFSDLPKMAMTSSSLSENACGMATPEPMPVLVCSSRVWSALRMSSLFSPPRRSRVSR